MHASVSPGTAANTTDALLHGPAPAQGWSQRIGPPALRVAGVFGLAMAVLGQLLMAVYVLGFYGRAALAGQPERWNEVLPHGYAQGQTFLNAVLATHLLFTVVVIVGGAVQLLPALRRRWPAAHRINGRAYLLAAAILSIGGLVMVWTRGTVGDLLQHLGTSLNALLILAFAGIAWRHARSRRFNLHRRWALRLFMAVSGVWFFRVGLMLWLVLNQGPVGFDPDTFRGPFLSVLAFAQCLLPLAVLELVFHVQDRRGPRAQLVMAAGLTAMTVLMMIGIAGAAMMMWLPRL